MLRDNCFKLEDVKRALTDSVTNKYKMVDYEEFSRLVGIYVDRIENLYRIKDLNNTSKENDFNSEILELKENNNRLNQDLQKKREECRLLQSEADRLVKENTQSLDRHNKELEEIIQKRHKKEIESLKSKHETEKSDLHKKVKDRMERVSFHLFFL